MKLDDLHDLSADDLEKITPEQMDEICKPFWPITRPALVQQAKAALPSSQKSSAKKGKSAAELEELSKIEAAKIIARNLGFNIK